jgi:hypothetical protein
MPFTRKALFLVVDSSNSIAFKQFARVFNQPLVSLMSPTEYPSSIKGSEKEEGGERGHFSLILTMVFADPAHVGNLFTLFLHAPLLAFAFISDVTEMSQEGWGKCQTSITAIEGKAQDILSNHSALGKSGLSKAAGGLSCRLPEPWSHFAVCRQIVQAVYAR